MFEDVINYFNIMIFKRFKSTNFIFNEEFAKDIVSILLDNDSKNKQLFFDSFKMIESNNKKEIVNICLANVINTVNFIINNCNDDKINHVLDYINNNKSLYSKIPNYLFNNIKNGLSENELNLIDTLNTNEKLTINSICINHMDYNKIKLSLNLILQKKEDFVKKTLRYKHDITELFKFYIPIYGLVSVFGCFKKPIIINTNDNYIKLYSINDIIKSDISIHDNLNKFISKKEYIYYMIYQFLITIKYNPEGNLYLNKIILFIQQDNDIDDETFNYLCRACKFATEYFSLEEKINNINDLKDKNIHKILTLYASFDIANYNRLEEKKKIFGLK